ncbi:GNAT family N-acetyltransferase [Streptomyces sp. VRA16 Mangrove soil]|uniref:GNAT family N-acetyltransferase n=1 Tax=Streptomyces sp. VRA16 Mangrove soil TaxID=2817434 RepID=UPI001A9F7210|nr:GNAT family protein [Streptomyces sp. VRA16 Mangrove soil]MBO1334695.1 GNAT family N-acetyltransferase [Streptomyces sp. VRA16 Mangrove soil]
MNRNRLPDLHGHHLWLRELRPTDLAPFERIHTHRVLTRYLGIDRMDVRQAQDAFARCLAQPFHHPRHKYTLAVCALDDDTMVGTMGLLLEEYGRNAMLTSLVLLPDAPVRGHGHEAGRLLMAHGFGPLGLHRIWAGHRADHTRMREIMIAAGLRPEATLRQLFHTQGTWHDVTTYAALAPEWIPQATRAERTILTNTPTSLTPA